MVEAAAELFAKLVRKLAVTTEEEDFAERRTFVSRHATQAVTTVAATLAQLCEAGVLSQAQVDAWDGDCQAAAPVLLILPAQDATPPAELRPTAASASVSVSAAHEVPTFPGCTALTSLALPDFLGHLSSTCTCTCRCRPAPRHCGRCLRHAAGGGSHRCWIWRNAAAAARLRLRLRRRRGGACGAPSTRARSWVRVYA